MPADSAAVRRSSASASLRYPVGDAPRDCCHPRIAAPARGGVHARRHQAEQRRAGGETANPDAWSALTAFTASVLTAPRSARPSTARVLRRRASRCASRKLHPRAPPTDRNPTAGRGRAPTRAQESHRSQCRPINQRRIGRVEDSQSARGQSVSPPRDRGLRFPASPPARGGGEDIYSWRKAAAIGRRAARRAGNSPPRNPMTSAQRPPCTSSAGVTSKANATCENVCQLNVAVW